MESITPRELELLERLGVAVSGEQRDATLAHSVNNACQTFRHSLSFVRWAERADLCTTLEQELTRLFSTLRWQLREADWKPLAEPVRVAIEQAVLGPGLRYPLEVEDLEALLGAGPFSTDEGLRRLAGHVVLTPAAAAWLEARGFPVELCAPERDCLELQRLGYLVSPKLRRELEAQLVA
ncbi:MAG: hypothetical protein IT377_06980 [Polyangiaceae bacterium]|nr:hypothetical protein [Polyangiaceae bacterium]